MFGTKTIATKLVILAREISAEYKKSAEEFEKNGNARMADRRYSVVDNLDILVFIVDQVFELGGIPAAAAARGR